MREAKLYPECRNCMSRTRQACDLLLLRGGTIVDPALWSSIPPQHLHTLLKNMEQATNEAVPPETLQEAITLSKSSRASGKGTAVSLPALTAAGQGTWESVPLPPAVQPLLSADGRSRR
eukprot:TRINITY_DN13470_c0_g1_i2.p3 TRINITY_DN13470_c0_g1~~TRINITY_DN13470_c0_g1_i2.p3  ORF type:complete len:119 (+),score=34.23 TRINITY_DN13470_c0_g1_i2:124-480(+)